MTLPPSGSAAGPSPGPAPDPGPDFAAAPWARPRTVRPVATTPRRLATTVAALALLVLGLGLVAAGWGALQRRLAVFNLVSSLGGRGPRAEDLRPPDFADPVVLADPAALAEVVRLGAVPPAVRAVAGALEEDLARGRADRVAGALAVLGELHAVATPAVPAVVQALRSAPTDRLRQCALRTLLAIDPAGADPATVPALLAVVGDPDHGDGPPGLVAGAAVTVLGRLDARVAARAAVPLVELLARPDAPAAAAVRTALVELGPLASPAVPQLTRLLGHRDPAVRAAAVAVLGAIGPEAEPAVPGLLQLLELDLIGGFAGVVEALAQIAPEDPRVISALRPLVGDAEPSVAAAARRAAARNDAAARAVRDRAGSLRRPGPPAGPGRP